MHKNKEEKTRDEEFKRNNSLENFLSEINNDVAVKSIRSFLLLNRM